MYTKRIYSESQRSEIDFGIADNKGRRLGVIVKTFRSDYEAAPDALWGGSPAPGTVHYCAQTWQTRDGKSYGAITREIQASTPAERDALVAKRIEDSRKRYAKRFCR